MLFFIISFPCIQFLLFSIKHINLYRISLTTSDLHKSAYQIIRCNCIDKNCYTYKYYSIFLCPFIITILCICQ